ncbi:hypothetical protein EON77_00695 [bacterium]|nr:MAG: hypothetical protein EON77_00695 [bacterium]
MEQHYGSSSDDRLGRPVLGGRNFTTAERKATDRSHDIPGWGSDLEPSRRPGVPRDKAPDIGIEHLYPGITAQRPRHRIHKSTEHARLTPVFGTSCPPRGLSGVLRDMAYRYSEGRMARWLTLMAADRVDVVEGIVTDVASGRGPEVLREMGLRSEWRLDRPRAIRKLVIAGALLGVAAALIVNRRRSHTGR